MSWKRKSAKQLIASGAVGPAIFFDPKQDPHNHHHLDIHVALTNK